jgi:hypothetical protein
MLATRFEVKAEAYVVIEDDQGEIFRDDVSDIILGTQQLGMRV